MMMAGLLLLLACTSDKLDDSGAGSVPTTTATSGWPLMLGIIREADSEVGLGGVSVVDVDRPSIRTTTGADGTWTLADAPVPYVTLRFTGAGLVPVEAWINPLEAVDPRFPYPMRMGGTAAVDDLYRRVGATREPGKVLLFVDAMDTAMSYIEGASVEISRAYESSWREEVDGRWVRSNLSTDDRTDLMFINVDPGPLSLVIVAPDGAPCEGPPDVVLHADELAQVSHYCAFTEP